MYIYIYDYLLKTKIIGGDFWTYVQRVTLHKK